MIKKLFNYISKNWVIFVVIGMFMLPVFGQISNLINEFGLNPYDYARITDVDYKAVVVDEPDSEGKVVITERLTFDIHAASKNNLFWELWRDLPEDYVDGVKVDYKVNSVKQILDDGTEIIYEESPKLYWGDYDYVNINPLYGPGKWYHSKGPYDESDAQYECVFFYVDGLYREEVVFEIEYEMHNAALRYNDCSDLYLALYSSETIKHLNSFKAQILFPNKDMPASGNYDVYTYGTNSNDFPVTESDIINPGYYTFFFELDERQLNFRPYNEYIEFDLVSHGEDKHIFTEYAPANDYSSDDVLDEIYEEQQEYASAPQRFQTVKFYVLLILSVGAILIIIYSFTAGIRTESKHTFYKPATEIRYFRDIPSDLDPNFAAALVHCRHRTSKNDSGIYPAILLSLARKKYITLEEKDDADIEITVIKPAPQSDEQATLSDTESNEADTFYEPLTPCEEYYFNLIVRHAGEYSTLMSIFQDRVTYDRANTITFLKNIKNSIVNIGVNEGYFQKADYTQPRKQMKSKADLLCITGILFTTLVNIISYHTRMDFAFGGFFIFGISCMIGSIYLRHQSKKYILLTQFGEDEYAKWRGLYNFLNSETLIHERTIIELPIWEKYLVYATAFGLSEKVIKAISINCPEAAESPILNNNCYRSTNFHHAGRSFSLSARSGVSISHSGGGFGYGGGGRGGGGGGGGH